MTRAAFRQCDVERLLRAAKRVGYSNPTVEKRPDGVLRLLTARAVDSPADDVINPWDAALADGVD